MDILKMLADSRFTNPVKVLGSIKAYAHDRPSEALLPKADCLTLLHTDYNVKEMVWVAVDHGAFSIKWFVPVNEDLDAVWKIKERGAEGATPEELRDLRVDFYGNHGQGEILFYSAWRMWRQGHFDLTKSMLTAAKMFDFEFRGLDVLEYLLANTDRYTYQSLPVLHSHNGQVACTELDDEFPAFGEVTADYRWTE